MHGHLWIDSADSAATRNQFLHSLCPYPEIAGPRHIRRLWPEFMRADDTVTVFQTSIPFSPDYTCHPESPRLHTAYRLGLAWVGLHGPLSGTIRLQHGEGCSLLRALPHLGLAGILAGFSS